MRLLHLVQTIKQQQELVGVHPSLSDLAWNRVLFVEFVHQPIREWLALHGPGREIENDRNRMEMILFGPTSELAHQFE